MEKNNTGNALSFMDCIKMQQRKLSNIHENMISRDGIYEPKSEAEEE